MMVRSHGVLTSTHCSLLRLSPVDYPKDPEVDFLHLYSFRVTQVPAILRALSRVACALRGMVPGASAAIIRWFRLFQVFLESWYGSNSCNIILITTHVRKFKNSSYLLAKLRLDQCYCFALNWGTLETMNVHRTCRTVEIHR